MLRCFCYVAALCIMLIPPAHAEEVRIRCEEGPYGVKPFTFAVDDHAKSVFVLEAPDLSPLEDVGADLKIDGKTITWAFMRGYVVFHRDTGTVEWDATDEYDYLDSIGQIPPDSRGAYKGHSKCAVEEHAP